MNLSYIGGSIAAIAITFVLGIIMYRALNDKYRQENMRYMENETTFTSNVYRLSSTLPMRLQEGYSCENLHIHEENQIPDIAVNNIGNVIQEYSDNDDEGFNKEYEALFHGEKYLCEIAKLPTNIPKNRFKTIVPCM
nr:uncharacterized protein LOC117687781 isoform X1 [Crassostrea gigas]